MNLNLKVWQCLSVMMVFEATLDPAGAGPKLADPKVVDPTSATPQASRIADPKATASKLAGQKVIARRPAETLEKLAHRILPRGAETLTRPVEMEFPPLGRVILVLYDPDPDARPQVPDAYSIYWGWLLVPEGDSRSYRIEVLPPLKDGYATLDYTIKSVFTADADGDGSPELCILSAVYKIGSGDQGHDYYDTDVFKWSGSEFVLVEQGDDRPLYGLRNAKAVRARFKKILQKQSVNRTEGPR